MHSYQISTLLIVVAFIVSLTQCGGEELPKVVWVYVQEEQSLNELERLSLNNIRYHCLQSQYELTVVTGSNYSSYLTNNDELEKILARQFIERQVAKKAYIQLTILQIYGGLWIDIPIMLTESLAWIQTIKNQRHINYRIDEPNAILFYSPQWFQQTFKRKSVKIEDLVIYPKYYSWFVATKQNSTFINDWRKVFIEIILKGQKDIDLFNGLYGLDPKEYLINPSAYLQWTLRATIKIKQSELDTHYGTVASVRRLAISQYKISGINADQTAYKINEQARRHTHLTTKYFTQVPLSELGLTFSYLLKPSQQVTNQIMSIIDEQIPLTEHLHSYVDLVCQGGKIPFRHIIQSSAVDQYLIKISKQSTTKRYSSQFVRHRCSVTYQAVFYEFLLKYVIPVGAAAGQIYIVRRMLLIFKPQWGVRRRAI